MCLHLWCSGNEVRGSVLCLLPVVHKIASCLCGGAFISQTCSPEGCLCRGQDQCSQSTILTTLVKTSVHSLQSLQLWSAFFYHDKCRQDPLEGSQGTRPHLWSPLVYRSSPAEVVALNRHWHVSFMGASWYSPFHSIRPHLPSLPSLHKTTPPIPPLTP